MVIFILILILLTPNFIIANDSVGTAGMQFLKLGSDARANSMAGAVVGEANDVDSIYWNPAGLSYLDGIMLTATYNKWIGDMNYFYLGYGMPLFINKLGVIGVSITFVDEGSIEDTYGNLGNINELNSYDLAISGAYGLKLGIISIGGALRFITKKILTERSTGGVVDIGGQLEIPGINNLKLGMIVRNLGWASKTVSKPDGMPIMYQAGVSYNLILGSSTILGLISSDIAIDDDPNINLGLEYGFKRILYLRGGYKFQTSEDDLGMMKGLSFGVGGRISLFIIDLNWISFGELGQSIQSTVSMNFGSTSPDLEEKSKSEDKSKPILKTPKDKPEKQKPQWIKKEEELYLKNKLVFENFGKEEIISKFDALTGTFEKVIEDSNHYGLWKINPNKNKNILKTSIRLPDLLKFDGILFSTMSKDITKFDLVLIEKIKEGEREWAVTVSDSTSEWRDLKVPFRYFYLKDNPNERMDLTQVYQIQFWVYTDLPEDKEKGLKPDYLAIDNISFYKE